MNYRLTLPPIEQLASLAALIQTETDADAKVKVAIAIWERAAHHIDKRNRILDRIEAEADMIEAIPFAAGHLDKALKTALRDSKPHDARKWWRDYTAHNIAFDRQQRDLPELSTDELESLCQSILERDRTEGGIVPASFMRFVARHKKTVAKERGKLGAAAKKKNAENNSLLAKKQSKNAPTKSKQASSKKKNALTKTKRSLSNE
jgi:hypothetical protein